jgi:predicted transposase YdaD
MRYSEQIAEQIFQGVTQMEESSTYQLILRRGKAEGLKEGRVTEARNLLLRLGEKRFGPVDPQSRTALEGLTELDRLEQLLDRMLDVKTWQQLLNGKA